MDLAAKRFARRVLWMHLLLLAIVLAGVVVASKEIYDRSRDRVIEQATLRQTLLANQTARGIQNYYESILANVDLLHRAEGEDAGAATREAAGTRDLNARQNGRPPGPPDDAGGPPRDRFVPGANRPLFGGPFGAPPGGLLRPTTGPDPRNSFAARMDRVLWRQLQGRVSLLFFYDRGPVNPRQPNISLIGSDGTMTPQQVIDANRAFINATTGPAVGPFQLAGSAATSRSTDAGVNLLCVPYPRDRVLIAVVPIEPVQTEFVRTLNDDPDQGSAWLTDGRLTVMAGSPTQVIGRMVGSTADVMPDHLVNGTVSTTHPFTIGSVSFAPALLTTQTLTVADKRWVLFVAQPLEQIESDVAKLLNRALLWGLFVVLSVTAILASTAWQLIRSRVRLERIRHDLLTKEMAQARQIQLAWLPVQPPKLLGTGGTKCLTVDLAAINTPASHISGDFYNWFPLPDGRLVVTIGDVTGHGMSAAFLMATTQLLVRNTMPRVLDPAACLTEVNQQLCVQAFNGQFVTMLICVLNLSNCSLQLATAGHPAPLIASTTDTAFRPLTVEPQLVLGVDPQTTFCTQHFDVPADTRLLLYTDGVVECANLAGERFGTRLQAGWTPPPPTARDALDGILARVDTFRGPRELSDDLTLVSLRLCASSDQ